MSTMHLGHNSKAFKKLQRSIVEYKYAYAIATANPENEKANRELIEAECDLMEKECDYYKKNILPILSAFKFPTMPERPDMFPDDDIELIKMIKSMKSKNKPTKDELDFMKIFGLWRGASMKGEIVAVGRLYTIMSSAKALDEMNEVEAFEHLARFIHQEYGVSLPPTPKNRKEIRVICGRACRRKDILSDILLTEEQRYQPTNENQTTFSDMF